MLRSCLISAFVLVGPSAFASENVAAAPVAEPTYEEFIRLDIAHRREVFATLSAETKTLLVRTHGERWLAANRGRLRGGQTAAVQAFIDFIPQLFDRPMNRESMRRELELTKTIRCRVGEHAFAEAFAILHPPPEHRRAWRDVVDSWLEWLVECLNRDHRSVESLRPNARLHPTAAVSGRVNLTRKILTAAATEAAR